MAHLDPNFSSYETFLEGADLFYSADLVALNSSGVTGNVLFAIDTDTNMLNVVVTASGLTANQTHIQHIHGVFDENGDPDNSVSPTLASDADGDGAVEVLEGLPSYGDILLPLDDADGNSPMADAGGNVLFFQSFDLTDDSNFFSPVSGADYTAADLMPLFLREYVIHGVDVPAGLGEGTGGEVDGSGGYTPILPAASAELVEISQDAALIQLNQQMSDASLSVNLDGQDNDYFAGGGDDTVNAGRGDDQVSGGDGNDVLNGLAGNDQLNGGEGNDDLNGGSGRDVIRGGFGNDNILGGIGSDTKDASAPEGDGLDQLHKAARQEQGRLGLVKVMIGDQGGDHQHGQNDRG